MEEPGVRTDAELMTSLAEGDLAALRELYGRHAPWLSLRLARRCSDPDVVADALQDCFTAVWREAGRCAETESSEPGCGASRCGGWSPGCGR